MTTARGRRSAGILMYRQSAGGLEVLLAHPGGPFWRGRDAGAWTIPKGEIAPGEEPYDAARREFLEETGVTPGHDATPLTPLRQPSGKQVFAWAIPGDCDPAQLQSNSFTMEWPPRSGKLAEFPEVDRIAWFDIPEARVRILRGQAPFLDQLVALLGGEIRYHGGKHDP